jgi:hypothetical protein
MSEPTIKVYDRHELLMVAASIYGQMLAKYSIAPTSPAPLASKALTAARALIDQHDLEEQAIEERRVVQS